MRGRRAVGARSVRGRCAASPPPKRGRATRVCGFAEGQFAGPSYTEDFAYYTELNEKSKQYKSNTIKFYSTKCTKFAELNEKSKQYKILDRLKFVKFGLDGLKFVTLLSKDNFT